MPLQLDTVAPLSPGSPETWLVDTPSGAVLGVVVADGKRRSLLMREPLPWKRPNSYQLIDSSIPAL